MKILCSKSGLMFEASYFPFTLTTTSLGVSHPIFQIPQKKLLSLASKWASQELTETDSYLYFLSLLNSTDLVEFRHPVQVTPKTSAIVANNMEDLIQIVGKMNLVTHPGIVFQKIAITHENNNLENVHYWLANWETNLEEFSTGYISTGEQQDLIRREAALEKLIRIPHKEIQLATQIANWAEIAGSFPRFETSTIFGKMELSEYWKLIIRKCINSESIFSIPQTDIAELIEHCEEKIEHGSIYAHTLMSILRNGAQKNKDFLGLGDWSSVSTDSPSFILLSKEDSIQKANLELLIATAPSQEPRITEYPSKFEYLKARMKWQLASQVSQVQVQEKQNDPGTNL